MIFYKEQGSGVPLVLLHGFCETHEIWEELIPLLAAHARVLSIDLPGFGDSMLPKTPFSIDEVAAQVMGWLKEKGVQAPVVVGHSLGGYVALAMARQDPDYCQKMVLFHSSAFADPEEKKGNRNKTIDFVKRNGVAPFLETFVPTLFFDKNHPSISRVRSITARTPAETLIAYTEAMRDRPSREDFLKKYKGLTLVMAGEEDGVIPIEISRKMAELSPKITFLTLEKTGHMGMYENTGNAAKALIDFVNKGFVKGM